MTSSKYFLFLVLGILAFSCSETPKLEGLWELQKIHIDMIPRGFKPTYLRIKADGTFSVSKEDGDIVGLYQAERSLLTLSSRDTQWFNRSWRVFTSDKELVLNDVKHSYRGAQLRFKKIHRFPDFEEFQQTINGKWELYKKKEKGITQVVTGTWFIVDGDYYAIKEGERTLEHGKVQIDTRHRKITFENAETTWDARFVWDELRLENDRMGITHRLRKRK